VPRLKTGEDDVLERGVWERLATFSGKADGRLVADVALCPERGGWPDGTGDHRIDAVWFPELAPSPDAPILQLASDVGSLAPLAMGQDLALVVARHYVDRTLLGLLLAGRDMFARSYPEHGHIRLIGVVDQPPDEANIEWVWASHGLEVVVLDG
jgi:hypothetical protein